VPTLHRQDGYVFEMVMQDCVEKRYAHVKGNGKGGAKFWLTAEIELVSPGRYNEHELSQIRRIMRANPANMIAKWDEECARAQSEGTAR
jgi:hypothetical protein